jgi:protease II
VFDLANPTARPLRRFPSHRIGFFLSQEEYRHNFQVALSNAGGLEVDIVREPRANSVQVLFTSLLSGEPEENEKGVYQFPSHHLVIEVQSSKLGSIMIQKIELPERTGNVLDLRRNSMQLRLECWKDFEVFEVSDRAAAGKLRPNPNF